jgi:hypothetical protein
MKNRIEIKSIGWFTATIKAHTYKTSLTTSPINGTAVITTIRTTSTANGKSKINSGAIEYNALITYQRIAPAVPRDA